MIAWARAESAVKSVVALHLDGAGRAAALETGFLFRGQQSDNLSDLCSAGFRLFHFAINSWSQEQSFIQYELWVKWEHGWRTHLMIFCTILASANR